MFEWATLVALFLLHLLREWLHDRERREWAAERRTLTEKAAAVRFGVSASPETSTARIELERLKKDYV